LGKVISIDINLFWQMLNFFILIFIFNKWFKGPISRIIEERKKIIVSDMESAKLKNEAAEARELKSDEILKEAKNKADNLVRDAEKKAYDEREDILYEARDKKNKILEEANEEATKMKTAAKADIQKEAVDLAVKMAEKIIQKNIDPSTTTNLIDEFINEVGE